MAAWLRLWHLGTKSLWLDEGATVALARASWQHFAWVWWHGEANLQTVYFLLMRAWIHGGLSEAWLRLPSALFGIASVPLLYVVARRLVPASAALASAALLTFSPAHVYYSHEARSYTLTIFLVLLSSYFFVRAVEGGTAQRLGAVDGVRHPCLLQSLLRCAGAGGAGLLSSVPQDVARDLETRHSLRAADCGGGDSRPNLRISRLTREPALHLDAARNAERDYGTCQVSLVAAASKRLSLCFSGLPGWLRLREHDGVTLKPSGAEC